MQVELGLQFNDVKIVPTWKQFEKNQSEGFVCLLNCDSILA